MGYCIGIDLGGTNIAAGCVDKDGRIIGRCSVPTGAHRPAEEVISDMADAAKKAAENAGVSIEEVVHVGIGVPGTANSSAREVVFAPNIYWSDVKLGKIFRSFLDIPVSVANDGDCAALGEALFGCAKDYENVILLTLGTGIGGGFIVDRKIFYGGTGLGTEPGHLTVNLNGEKCGCGKRGCFETEASCTALIREARRAMHRDPSCLLWEECGGNEDLVEGRTVFAAARRGDASTLAVLDRYTDALAAGTGSLIGLFWPQAIIIGGGISAEEEYIIEPLRRKLPQFLYAGDKLPVPPVFRASLGNDAGIIGAAFIED